ncbi:MULTISPECIES: spore coat U domain-containing protein [unclassified Caballeronia]|uniref:Csu type fimbrial protein n=1 Tax=unclassified Caballeronia TaxID=2646786 RepID=UPI001FD4B1FB|nr:MULTISPECIES: spore coat U domain-containing protein [unclassified Caballeronia]
MVRRAGEIALVLTLASGLPLAAEGATSKTATFTVSLTIQADCDITANSLDFGSTGIIQTNIDQTTTVNVTCTKGTAYNIGLDQGSVSGSAVATRLLGGMGSPNPTVNFGLYRDSARTQNWGQTIGTDTLSGTGTGSSQALTVYGRVPTQTAPAAGAYTSTITATVTF